MSLLPEAIQVLMDSMSWDLHDPPPMFFKSLKEMASIRCVDVFGILASIQQSAATQNENTECLARIATSLLLLGNGYTDEAHNLILSLSWRGELPYAYHSNTASETNLEDETVQALACYAHCLVHRREGPHASEFNMTGFQNSNFWAGTTMRNLVGVEPLPLEKIRDAIVQLGNTGSAAAALTNGALADFLREIQEDDHGGKHWDPRLLTELCHTINTKLSEEKQPQPPPELQKFAEQAAMVELRLLLDYVLKTMGFET